MFRLFLLQVNNERYQLQQRSLTALVDAARKSESAAVKTARYIHRKRHAEKEE